MKNLLTQLLKYYENEDFALKLKARFVLIFTFITILTVFFATIYSTFLLDSFDIVIIPISVLLVITLISLNILIKGKFHLAIYIIMTSGFLVTWLILFFEPVSAINKINTIVYVIALLSATPFLFTDKKYPLFFYFGSNIFILFGYCYYLGYFNILNKVDLIDFLLDNTIAFIFVFAISYNLFFINRSLLSKIGEDLREKNQLNKKLSTIQLILNNIITAMPSILIVIDKNFRVTRWNKEAENFTGITSSKAEQSDLFEILPNLNFLKEKLKNVILKGIIIRNERIKVNWGQNYQYVDIVVYPLVLDKIEGVVIRIDDISDNIKMEEHMIQSEKMITLGTLATGMAHTINNPLAGMLQNAQLALNRLKNIDQNNITVNEIEKFIADRNITKILDRVCLEGNRIANVIDEMLSFSNPTSSKYLFNNIEDVLEKSILLAHNDYELKTKYKFDKIHIMREYESNLPEFQCSQSKIMQVILILLKNSSNAIYCRDYDKNEKPQIILRTKKENQKICFEVEDNGIGMPKEVLKRIFEPFYTTMPVGEGSGLGLYIAYFIITRNHNGTIKVESKQGIGTKFTLKLPITI